jgi:hypothetical protein
MKNGDNQSRTVTDVRAELTELARSNLAKARRRTAMVK